MNKYEHSDQSAKIFGGRSKDYHAIHALIDSNKLVTPSIFGRFLLHHIDVGLPILESIFGETVGKKKTPVRQVLMQHLIEDYGRCLTFKKHWMPVLAKKTGQFPLPDDWHSFSSNAKNDPRIRSLGEVELRELEDFFRLKTLCPLLSFSKNTEFAIFGHALGGDIAAQVLGPKFHGLWTSDVVTGYLNCRFVWADRTRDPVPTLLDYERHVLDRPWMHAPADADDVERRKPEKVKEKIGLEEQKSIEVDILWNQLGDDIFERRSCNLD